MTTLLEIKPHIYEYVKKFLDDSFSIYWLGERIDEPTYPYCVLTTIAESKNYRTSAQDGGLTQDNKREKIYTRYKTCTITISVYTGWTSDTTGDFAPDEQKEFAYQQIDRLEGAFEYYPLNNDFSVQGISPIRPLHEPVSGGYMFRYEFDLTIGYNEPETVENETGKAVDVQMSDNDISFKVTIKNNDTISVEQTKGVKAND